MPASKLAGIQYGGEPGLSRSCQEAVERHIQGGNRLTHARVLTHDDSHGLLLRTYFDELTGIKTGFGSGYSGEGPRRFSIVLNLLDSFGVEVSECIVSRQLLDRLDASALTKDDIETIQSAPSVRGARWREYLLPGHWSVLDPETPPWSDMPLVMPFRLVDARLADLAIDFWEGPDDRLMTSFRRLEDVVRKRTGLRAHGAKLFSQAFLGESSKLLWESLDPREQAARAALFVDGFGAFRNPRAHRELHESAFDQLAEFLFVNHLFLLERKAISRAPAAPADA